MCYFGGSGLEYLAECVDELIVFFAAADGEADVLFAEAGVVGTAADEYALLQELIAQFACGEAGLLDVGEDEVDGGLVDLEAGEFLQFFIEVADLGAGVAAAAAPVGLILQGGDAGGLGEGVDVPRVFGAVERVEDFVAGRGKAEP